MSRAIVFRIVGFAFLASAAFNAYQGEYGADRSGQVVISAAHDPASFWRGIIIQIAVGCVVLYLSRSTRGPKAIDQLTGGEEDPAQEAASLKDRPKLPNYDPEFCGKIVKAAAFVCAGLIGADLLVLLLVHPSDDRCPHWVFHAHQRSAASLWLLAGLFSVLPGLWICYVALRWDNDYDRKMYDSIANGPPQQLLIEGNSLAVMVLAGWCLFCAIPLFLMLGSCTGLSGYLNAGHL